MLSVQDAETIIQNLVQPFNSPHDRETVELLNATGRILATAVTSKLDFPHWDNSAMDGYAVRHNDVANCSPEHPIELQIIEEIPAGQVPQSTVQSGQTARIFTGAMIPAGADTIVMQENTQRSSPQNDRVTILQAPEPRSFIRQQGSYYQAGHHLLNPGIKLAPPDIAILAALQCAQVAVYRRPRVAIFSTGNELVSLDRLLQPGQIVDSNQYALAALVQQTGAEPILLGIVPDDPYTLKTTIALATQQADIVLSSGGVSVGDYDYIDRLLAELEATLHIRSIAVKPGKPLTVATLPGEVRPKLYFGLPGNPVSALVSFWRFIQPAIQKMTGRVTGYQPAFVVGVTAQELRAGGQRETYLWGQAIWQAEHYQFNLASGIHNSGNLINLAQTNALALIPVGTRHIPAGERVKLLLMH